MSRPKKCMDNGRLTTEAAEIVVEMLKEGEVQGDLKWLSGGKTPPTIEIDERMTATMSYFIGGYWVRRDLSCGDEAIIGFTQKADRKEFKRRWRERYPTSGTKDMPTPRRARTTDGFSHHRRSPDAAHA